MLSYEIFRKAGNMTSPKSPRLSGEALNERQAEPFIGVCPFADLANEGHTPDPAQAGKRDFKAISINMSLVGTKHIEEGHRDMQIRSAILRILRCAPG